MVAVPKVPKAPPCCRPSKAKPSNAKAKKPPATRIKGAKKVAPKKVSPKKSTLGTPKPCRCARPRPPGGTK